MLLLLVVKLRCCNFLFRFSPSLKSDDEMYARIDPDSSVEEICDDVLSTDSEEVTNDVMLVHQRPLQGFVISVFYQVSGSFLLSLRCFVKEILIDSL